MTINVAILTVSDTAAKDAAADLSGPQIREIITSKDGYQVQDGFCRIVPDEKEEIHSAVSSWVESENIDWVITAGGTGFGVRDVTPEALSPLIERPAPGIVHLLISSSLNKTPFAALSRPIAGTAKNTLITTLPGSLKAVTENLEALFDGDVIHHALDLIKGGTGREIHSQLSAGGTGSESSHSHGRHGHHGHHGSHGHRRGHSHSHEHGQHRKHSHHRDHSHHRRHHDHKHEEHRAPKPRSQAALSHDPSASVASRHRVSPFAQISLEDALQLVKTNVDTLPVVNLPVNAQLGGHILAEDIYAPCNVPSTFTTSVDGYALRSIDPPGVYTVLTSQTRKIDTPLPEGCIYRVNTGGPLPAGADTVIMVEDTKLVSVHQEDGPNTLLAEEEKQVETLAQIPEYENVRKPGSDVRAGELVMSKGEKITKAGGEIGTLAFVGRKQVAVYKKPKVAILSTGNEIVDIQAPENLSSTSSDSWGGIFDTNRPSLTAALENLGYEVLDLGIVPDDVQSHLTAIRKGLAEADLLLTTGGTSMGPTDLLKPLIERHLDGVIHFGRVSVKPGKPTTFARVPVKIEHDVEVPVTSPSGPQVQVQVEEKNNIIWKPVFALPGNPASALVTFYVFVIPALRRLGGWPTAQLELPKVNVELQNTMPLDPRTEYHRVILKTDLQSGAAILKAYSTGGQRSSRAASLCNANGLVILPPLAQRQEDDGRRHLETGDIAKALVIGEIEME
ncbi:MoaB/Mog domain-containing protein [Crepidotus variabilis]|uniref:MoaB/Mog domain-containing protein n=1 Tax=Crepidotus variabilis TaxID=179855 RepID=A0A9P6EFB3_9AGAR|nr:MoaB/Mog domain-containing protein [Crepidotus variabilis]